MSHVSTKPLFGVCDQLRLKPACSATETSLGLEISAIANKNQNRDPLRAMKTFIRRKVGHTT